MKYIIDLIVLAIIIITALFSSKKGFARTFIEIVGFVLVIFIVNSISVPISNFIYDKTVSKKITSATENISVEKNYSADKFFDSLPEIVTKKGSIFEINKDEFEDYFNKNINEGMKAASTQVSDKVVKPVFVKVLSLIVSTVLFIILNFAVHFIAKFVNSIFKRGLLSGINRRLGFIIGLPKGIIFALFFLFAILLIINLTQNGFWIFTQNNVYESYSVKFLNKILPDKGIFSYLFF